MSGPEKTSKPLHPRQRYGLAAKKLMLVLTRIHELFLGQGLYVPVVQETEMFAIRWDPRRKEFGWRELPEGNWRTITADLEHPGMDIIELGPVVDLLNHIPELYQYAQNERDRLADMMDVAADQMEDWLQSQLPYVLREP